MNLTFHTVLRELREGLNGQPTKNIMPVRYLSDCYLHNAYVMENGLHTHAPSLPMHPQQPLRLDEHTIPDTLGAAVIQFPASEESLGRPNGICAWF